MQDKIIVFPAQETSSYPFPTALTPLIGRERELTDVCNMLLNPNVRLLTLTGTGGVGKTRLAIEVAQRVQDKFADGVCFVSLAPLSDPEHVLPAIAQTLGMRETREYQVLAQLQTYLHTWQLLLLLDNFEHVAAAAPYLLDLLTTCPHLHLFITSRATLYLPGEYEFPVLPLGVPDLTQQLDDKAVAHVAAVQLFVQRARAVQPSFRLTMSNTPAVVAICNRLDGLPLALELAATRIKLLPPHALLKRLERPLNVLTHGTSDLPSRQQTIRRTIQWSYDLLDRWEQLLFRLCTVFVGGFTLQAVEAICMALHEHDGIQVENVLKGVDSLVNKSLLQPPSQEEDTDEEPRLGMLETVREYGCELLQERGELEAVRRAHATFCLQFAEEAVKQAQGTKLLARDYENVRAAMTWMLENDNEANNVQRIEMALRLCILLEPFWKMRGFLSEGWSLMERALAKSDGVAPEIRTQSLITAATLLGLLGNQSRANTLFEQSLAQCKEQGDMQRYADCLRSLGWLAQQKGNLPRAQALYEEALTLFRTLNAQQGIASSLSNMSQLAQYQGNYEQAYHLQSEALALFRAIEAFHDTANQIFQLSILLYISREQTPVAEIQALLNECITLAKESGDKYLVAEGRCMLGVLAFAHGDLEIAYSLLSKGISFCRKSGGRMDVGIRLPMLARVAIAQGDYNSAQTFLTESIAIGRELEDTQITMLSLQVMAELAAAQEQRAWAVHLWGAVEKLREIISYPMAPFEYASYQREITTLRTYFGEHIFAILWAEGRALSPDEALAARDAELPKETLSAQKADPSKNSMLKANAYPDSLSAREVEVLRLLAQGNSDAQIAEHLIISVRTVNTHVTSIYRKIHVTTRASATRYAFEHQI